jgi:hypothetical protein
LSPRGLAVRPFHLEYRPGFDCDDYYWYDNDDHLGHWLNPVILPSTRSVNADYRGRNEKSNQKPDEHHRDDGSGHTGRVGLDR